MEHYKPGSTISFRLPSDIAEEQLNLLNQLKKEEGRGFSRKAAQLFLQGLSKDLKDKFMYTLVLDGLTDDERRWLDDKHTKELISAWVKQLVREPDLAFSSIPSGSPRRKEESADKKEKTDKPTFNPESPHTLRLAKQLLS